MTDAVTISREGFLKALNTVKPALAAQSYVPVLAHVCFRDTHFYAYNDVMAVTVKCKTGLTCAIPGDLLLKLVNSLTSETVLVTIMDDAQALVSGGRSRVKLPILPESAFVFKLPERKALGTVEVDDEFLIGLERCLISVGSDPARPSGMGVTLIWQKSGVNLYSTDNVSCSRFNAKSTKFDFPVDMPLVLPTSFCQQLVDLSRVYKDQSVRLEVFQDYVLAKFGSEAELFSKFVLDVSPMDFEKIISRFTEGRTQKPIEMPDTLKPAFQRALLVLDDKDKATRVSLDGKRLLLATTTPMGDVRDQVNLLSEVTDELDFTINPELVVRCADVCKQMILYPDTFVGLGSDGKFFHLIAHYASAK